MPDPLLVSADLENDYQRATKIAKRCGATLSRQGNYVFLECNDQEGHRKLARIDCQVYPNQPLDVVFVDPEEGKRPEGPPSSNRKHWPPFPSAIAKDGTLLLCLAGVRSYLRVHDDPGYQLKLGTLVFTLIQCCKGRMPPRSQHRRR